MYKCMSKNIINKEKRKVILIEQKINRECDIRNFEKKSKFNKTI